MMSRVRDLGQGVFAISVTMGAVQLVVLLLAALARELWGLRILDSSDAEVYFYSAATFPGRPIGGLVDYPVLAVPIFLLPRLLTHQISLYVKLFALEMWLVNVLLVWMVARWIAARDPGAVRARLAWYTGFFVALCPVIVTRFDLVPTAIAFAAVVAWLSHRPAVGGVAAALGGLMKVFPFCAAAPLVLCEAARFTTTRLRGGLAFFTTALIGGAMSWALGGSETLRYHLERGIQLESIPAGVLMAVGTFTGGHMAAVYQHRTMELLAPGAAIAGQLTLVMEAFALLFVLWRFWRSGMRDPMRWVTCALLASIVCAKVLSPQYLIWLMPFIAVGAGPTGRRTRVLFLLACLITTLIFPFAYRHLMDLELWAIGLLNLRNALLVTLFAVLLREPNASPQWRPESRSGRWVGEAAHRALGPWRRPVAQ